LDFFFLFIWEPQCNHHESKRLMWYHGPKASKMTVMISRFKLDGYPSNNPHHTLEETIFGKPINFIHVNHFQSLQIFVIEVFHCFHYDVELVKLASLTNNVSWSAI
jgi:hypothetical protein